MATITTQIELYLEANSKSYKEERSNIILQNDGTEDYIHTWNVSGVAKPTAEQLNSYDSNATTRESNNVQIKNRRAEYGLPRQQIANIIENGLEAEQARVQAIKDKYPKE
tara:strand:+ start:544 stop:873 length:330 start_codon:yes stop_codon:yes gene_type:complete